MAQQNNRPPLYRIRDWQRRFEIAGSRKIVGELKWVAIPYQPEFPGYRRVIAGENGIKIFGAWILLIHVAGRMSHRGVLANENGPLDAEELAFITGAEEEVFDIAFETLTEPRIGWLEIVPDDECAELLDAHKLGTSRSTVAAEGHMIAREVRTTEPGHVRTAAGGDGTTPERDANPSGGNGSLAGGSASPVGGSGSVVSDAGSVLPMHAAEPALQNITGHDPIRPGKTGYKKTEPERKGANGIGSEGLRIDDNGSDRSVESCRRAADTKWRNDFVIAILDALGIPFGSERAIPQRRPLLSVCRRIDDRPNRDAIKAEMVEIAREKRTAGMDNPAAAWQAEIDRRYPSQSGSQPLTGDRS